MTVTGKGDVYPRVLPNMWPKGEETLVRKNALQPILKMGVSKNNGTPK